jgi:hypothetical protein
MSQSEQEAWLEANTWSPSVESGLEVQDDLSPAAWLESRLASGTFEVRMTAPEG